MVLASVNCECGWTVRALALHTSNPTLHKATTLAVFRRKPPIGSTACTKQNMISWDSPLNWIVEVLSQIVPFWIGREKRREAECSNRVVNVLFMTFVSASITRWKGDAWWTTSMCPTHHACLWRDEQKTYRRAWARTKTGRLTPTYATEEKKHWCIDSVKCGNNNTNYGYC